MIFSLPRLSGAVEDATSKAKQVRFNGGVVRVFSRPGRLTSKKGSLKRDVFIPILGGFKF